MKKESSFKLRSGNDLGKSAAKLMKQSPARAEEKPQTKTYMSETPPVKGPTTPKHTVKSLKEKLDKDVSTAQAKLESKIRGFFGNLQKGFQTSKKKRDIASTKRTKQVREGFETASEKRSKASKKRTEQIKKFFIPKS